MAPWVSDTLYFDRITEAVFNRYAEVSPLSRTFKYSDSLIRADKFRFNVKVFQQLSNCLSFNQPFYTL